MNMNQTRLENLPNEILFEVFKNLDAGELYQAFYNHNYRFNALLKSFNGLYLILSIHNNHHNFDSEPFSPSIHTLIVNKDANVILGHFLNVHRLILHWLQPNVLQKLELDIFPHLEYLSIQARQLSYEPTSFDLAYKIFTNGFPQLKVCLLPDMIIRSGGIRWIHTPTINVLKVGQIDSFVYKDILSFCPNLRIFEFAIDRCWAEMPIAIEHHSNIKTLVIKQVFYNNRIINMCLSCVPNVQRLDIYLKDCHVWDAEAWSKRDWFKPIIDLHLSKLRRMNMYLCLVLGTKKLSRQDEYILGELERSFERIRTNRYKTILILNQKEFVDSTDSDDMDE